MLGLSGVDRSAVTREAIREHPGTFVRGIGRTFWEQLWSARMYAPFVEASTSEGGDGGGRRRMIVSGRRLPWPTDGEPIPASRFGPNLWTQCGARAWRSPTDHSFVFDDPRDERRYEKFGRDSDRLVARIPTRDPNEDLVHRLNQASRLSPRLSGWLSGSSASPCAALALLVAVTPAAAGLTVIFASPSSSSPSRNTLLRYSSVRAARCGGVFAPRREGAAAPVRPSHPPRSPRARQR